MAEDKSKYIKLMEEVEKREKNVGKLFTNLKIHHRNAIGEGLKNALKIVKKDMSEEEAEKYTIADMLEDRKYHQLSSEQIYESHKDAMKSVFGVDYKKLEPAKGDYMMNSMMKSSVSLFRNLINQHKGDFIEKYDDEHWNKHLKAEKEKMSDHILEHIKPEDIGDLLQGDKSKEGTDLKKYFAETPFIKDPKLASAYLSPISQIAYGAFKNKGIDQKVFHSDSFHPYLKEEYKPKEYQKKAEKKAA